MDVKKLKNSDPLDFKKNTHIVLQANISKLVDWPAYDLLLTL
jgi:hypothetical protein